MPKGFISDRNNEVSKDDLIVWPDGTTCTRAQLSEMGHMSDDYVCYAVKRTIPTCPYCGRKDFEGHKPDCEFEQQFTRGYAMGLDDAGVLADTESRHSKKDSDNSKELSGILKEHHMQLSIQFAKLADRLRQWSRNVRKTINE